MDDRTQNLLLASRSQEADATTSPSARPQSRSPKKRKLSAAGRKRIIEATKKRWTAYKAKQAKA